MSVIEMIHTHPFAAGVAVGMLLAFCSLGFCTAYLVLLEKTKAMAHESSMRSVESKARKFFSGSSSGSTESTSAAYEADGPFSQRTLSQQGSKS